MDDTSFREKHASSTNAENYKGGSNACDQHSSGVRSFMTEGRIDLKDALNNLKNIPNPNKSMQSQITQYENILNSEGKYEQEESEYGPYYLMLQYYVLNDTVYAIIDYSGFAGTFNQHGVVTCAGEAKPVIIKAVGVNEYTGGEHVFTFTINADVANVTGSEGFGKKTCRRVGKFAK